MHVVGMLGERLERGVAPPSLWGSGGPPLENFEILHAIWWHPTTSEAILMALERYMILKDCILSILCVDI